MDLEKVPLYRLALTKFPKQIKGYYFCRSIYFLLNNVMICFINKHNEAGTESTVTSEIV